jgi:hypothetical protein
MSKTLPVLASDIFGSLEPDTPGGEKSGSGLKTSDVVMIVFGAFFLSRIASGLTVVQTWYKVRKDGHSFDPILVQETAEQHA